MVGNGRKHDQAKTCSTRIFFKISNSAQRCFFFEGPKVSKGKRLETVGDRTFARQKSSCFVAMFMKNVWKLCKNVSFLPREGAISDCFQPFPLGHLWTFKKKNGVARKCLFKKKCGLNKFWPDHVSDRFRPFPTVSDRFRPFHFFWRFIGPLPFMEGWSSANPCKPWRLSFLVPPTAPNIASWPWYPIFPKNH